MQYARPDKIPLEDRFSTRPLRGLPPFQQRMYTQSNNSTYNHKQRGYTADKDIGAQDTWNKSIVPHPRTTQLHPPSKEHNDNNQADREEENEDNTLNQSKPWT